MHHAFWWNETISGCGADDIASVNYLYDTNKNVGQVLEPIGVMALQPKLGTAACFNIAWIA
jgi:hypothetical protein